MKMALLVGTTLPLTDMSGPYDDFPKCMEAMAAEASVVPPDAVGEKLLTVGMFCVRDDAQGGKKSEEDKTEPQDPGKGPSFKPTP